NRVLTRPASQASKHEELGRLAAALCDGEWTAQDSQRLDHLARDPEALAFLSRYLILVGELHWSSLGTAGPRSAAVPAEKPAPLAQPSPPVVRSTSRAALQWMGTIAGLAAALVLAVLWWVSPRRASVPAKEAARLLGSFSATDSAGAPTALSDWVCGETKRIDRGVAAWGLPNGNTWILEGPAAAVLESPNRVRLEKGRAVFQIAAPGEGFSVETPFGCFIDRGTAFALAVDETGAEIHVLEGAVEFRRSNDGAADHAKPEARSQAPAPGFGRDMAPPGNLLRPGQAVRLDAEGGRRPIAFAAGRFIRELPRPGSSGVLQLAALRAEHVLRVFSFESPDGRFRERITGEPLLRTILKGGGDLAALSIEPGWGIGSQAVRIQRGNDNTAGAALQTEAVFTPPGLLSLETVFRYDGFPDRGRGDAVGSLLATRQDRDRASFFLAAAGDGTLMHLFDARENWLVTEGRLEPGHWYYAAAAFEECDGRVMVDTWLADLSLGERRLRQVLRRGQAVGGMAPGRLAIGKGFDSAGAHAYAFPGTIDEIVLYNEIVGENVFNEHLRLLVGDASSVPPLPAIEAEVTAGRR
ncbi:MAG: FecR domain-containing protein, partial [Thermogutta sp.]|nr:FecR domain-containing protein [Thermogutta sp.]